MAPPAAGAKPLAVPAARTWNMCMLAHVDHGKSALSDALVASNGHISARTAGHVRYLDSRADEQRRGITMKSSSIALGARGADGELRLVNLVDSPGHVDFTGEVDAALRVCDGCLIVVDIIEGVCVQTVGVLKAALERGVVPCLVLNKVDRLFCELKLGVVEAYWRIVRVLEQVNVVMGVREVEDMMARADVGKGEEWEVEGGDDGSSGYFSPEKGNVVFASATDGWAFRVEEFAGIFSGRFGISERVLTKTLWGDYVLVAKSKKIVRKSRRASGGGDGKQVMFVSMVLSSLHSVYDAVYSTANDMELAVEKRTKIATKLGLTLTNRDLRHKDAAVALRAIMSAWLPAAPALLGAIMSRLPTAADAQRDPARMAVLWPHLAKRFEEGSVGAVQKAAVESADSRPGAPLLAFVTKMLEPVDAGSASGGRMNIRVPRARPTRDEDRDGDGGVEIVDGGGAVEAEAPKVSGLVAFARLLSGTVAVGDTVFVYGPRYVVKADGSYDETSVAQAKVTALYLLMGRDMEVVSKAIGGCVVGIAGLGDVVLKTATVSSLPPGACLPLGSSERSTALGASNDSVVRVAVEPHLPKDVSTLQAGLRKLNQADPAVDAYVTSMGEHVIAASGELHLERCLLDLRERFAPGVKIHVSPPIISFREGIVGEVSTPPLLDVQEGFKLHTIAPVAMAKKDLLPVSAKRNATAESAALTDSREQTETLSEHGDSASEPASRPVDSAHGWGTSLQGTKAATSALTERPALKDVASPFLKKGRFVDVGNAFVSFRLCTAPLPTNLATALDEVGNLVRESITSKGEEASLAGKLLDSAKDLIDGALERDAEESGWNCPSLMTPLARCTRSWRRDGVVC
jgi:ribosome assembly protein 1